MSTPDLTAVVRPGGWPWGSEPVDLAEVGAVLDEMTPEYHEAARRSLAATEVPGVD